MASHFLGLWLFFGFFKGPHPWGFLLYNLGALGWCISIQVHSLQLLLKPLRMWLLSPAIFCWGFSILLGGSIRQGPGWPQLGSFFCMTPICFPGNTRTFLARQILGMSANPNTVNPVLLPRTTLAFSEWRTTLILCLYCREQMSSSLHGPVKHPLTRVEVKEVTYHVSKHSCGRWCEALAWQ